MRNIAREQIKQLFNNPQKTMGDGLWFSGYDGEGEYKRWWSNGKIFKHCFYKNGNLDGEFKMWNNDGTFFRNLLFIQRW